MAAKRLSDAERAAVLRAARDRIQKLGEQLEVEAERMRRKFPGSKAAYDIVASELMVLDAAVRKLWVGGNGNGHE